MRRARLPEFAAVNMKAFGLSYRYSKNENIMNHAKLQAPSPIPQFVTCYPFEFVWHAPKRFIVCASRYLP